MSREEAITVIVQAIYGTSVAPRLREALDTLCPAAPASESNQVYVSADTIDDSQIRGHLAGCDCGTRAVPEPKPEAEVGVGRWVRLKADHAAEVARLANERDGYKMSSEAWSFKAERAEAALSNVKLLRFRYANNSLIPRSVLNDLDRALGGGNG